MKSGINSCDYAMLASLRFDLRNSKSGIARTTGTYSLRTSDCTER